MSLAQVVEWLAWLSVLANLWWFHRRIVKLERKHNIRIRHIEIVSDSPAELPAELELHRTKS